MRHINYSPPVRFINYIGKICERFAGLQIIWINILPATEDYEKTLPGISQRVNEYNKILDTQAAVKGFSVLDTAAIPREGIMSDHHHLTTKGHLWISDRLLEMLNDKKT